jgi:murein DD-endopeptidase MepM/ murein hydrolase activator NlpD
MVCLSILIATPELIKDPIYTLFNNRVTSPDSEYYDYDDFSDKTLINIIYTRFDNSHSEEIVGIPNTLEIIKTDGKVIDSYLKNIKEIHYVKKADNLIKILNDNNISAADTRRIIFNTKGTSGLESLKIGNKLEIYYKKGPDKNYINTIKYFTSKKEYLFVERIIHTDEFTAMNKTTQIIKKFHNISFNIKSNLYHDGINNGLSPTQIMQLVDIFQFKIDLSSGLKSGDRISVSFENHIVDKEVVERGKILYASIYNGSKITETFYFKDDKEKYGYFDENGENMFKSFDKHPIEDERITSRFDLKRMHPIYKVRRPHRGTDYGGYKNKKIHATATGKVIYAGRKGGYGKVIVIQHGNKFKTLYAHLNKIPSSIKKNTNVTRGQLIGYMGTTGASTGVHLHYELFVNGSRVNSLTYKYEHGSPVYDPTKFRSQKNIIYAKIKEVGIEKSKYASTNKIGLGDYFKKNRG